MSIQNTMSVSAPQATPTQAKLPLSAALTPRGEAMRLVEVDAATTPTLRPVYQLAHSLALRFKEIGASCLIVERYAEIDLKSTSGLSLGLFRNVLFDFAPGRQAHIVLSNEHHHVTLPYSQLEYERVTSNDGGCLWCGMPSASECPCRGFKSPNFKVLAEAGA
ncbi:hypothetical protein LJR189_004661 [Acidovorax delafieldii]|uniref:hypothetical protein n=1 Tax=Acidovorax delafieldii TaxID=47920 RepID=UPI003ECCD44C